MASVGVWRGLCVFVRKLLHSSEIPKFPCYRQRDLTENAVFGENANFANGQILYFRSGSFNSNILFYILGYDQFLQ